MKKLQEKKNELLKLFNEEASEFHDTEEVKEWLIDRWINTTLGSIVHIKNKLNQENTKMLDEQLDLFAPLVLSKKYLELQTNYNDLKLELEALYMIKHIDLIKEGKR